tara:strand:+ start:380 stop:721 length:342 start_codon:yes stop_codon:yes gene_type:complete
MNIKIVTARLIKICENSIELTPKKAPLNNSTIDVAGFRAEIILYFSGTILKGYTIGVANIHNCNPKLKAKVRSRYFAVRAESKMPTPKLSIINCKRTRGRNKIFIKLKLSISP